MPTYAYGCDNCGVRFDRYQSFDDPPLTECPECGQEALRKLYTPVGVVFKGSGFYSTDHRSPSGQVPPRKTEDNAAPKDAGAAPEKKPATKSAD
jgi:putative FmdB family regulatory protein